MYNATQQIMNKQFAPKGYIFLLDSQSPSTNLPFARGTIDAMVRRDWCGVYRNRNNGNAYTQAPRNVPCMVKYL